MTAAWHAFGQWLFFSDVEMSPLGLFGFAYVVITLARRGGHR